MKAEAALVIVLFAGAAGAATAAEDPAASATYRAEIERWREEREARLRAEYGWLSVAGLFWLDEGKNPFGSDPEGAVVLPPPVPAKAGVFNRSGEHVSVRAEPGVKINLEGHPMSDPLVMAADGAPLELDRLRLQLIRRGSRLGIRVRDPESRTRREFKGLTWFPTDPAYRIEARFYAYDPPRTRKIENVLGHSTEEASPGYALFDLRGETVRLHAIYEDGDTSRLFFIFKDKTAPTLTYGGGRTLYADLPEKERVIVDFNKAYNPPCAFSDYTTCPLPPKENRLSVEVKAGEKKYR
jgi:uncharacterized protein (DUF1684 family)